MTLLTIALPTYNREQSLDRQLEWLSNAIKGHEEKLEILISDNCSTDNTPEVIERWRPAFAGTRFHAHRNDTNIGAVRNIAQCIHRTATPHVWTISDDDPIELDAVGYVLEQLERRPDLALIVLNFSNRNVFTGKLNFAQYYKVEDDRLEEDGRKLFKDLICHDCGGVTLTTALIYETKAAQDAFNSWPEGLDNVVVQLYVTGFCATRGPAVISGRNFLECAAGDHHFMANPAVHHKMVHVDIPLVYAKFLEIGYSYWFFVRMFGIKLTRNISPDHIRPFCRRLRVLLGGVIKHRFRKGAHLGHAEAA